ncbi:MAG: hypothetical protein ABWZ30_05450 [Jiangellaceae bacterium]
MSLPRVDDAAPDKWQLYCENDYIYTTTDAEDAESWVAADPAQHTARKGNRQETAAIERLVDEHREVLDLMGKGGWTGKTGLEQD